MESVDKLRDYGHQCCARIDDAIHDYCDEIEREIAEHYMELPVDSEGVLIRIGDTVCEVDDRVLMKVMSLTFYEDCVDVNACGMNPNLLRHVKPRTLEDVLADVVTLCANAWKDDKSPFAFYDVSDVMASGNIREYAEEIRELLGGDAE